MIEFEYNGKVLHAENLEKKLKKMRLTMDDIKILGEIDSLKKEISMELDDRPKHHFINQVNNYTITSIYDTVDQLPVEDKHNWIKID